MSKASDESITVQKNGNTVVVYKGDSSDAEWDALKAKHLPKTFGQDAVSEAASSESAPEEPSLGSKVVDNLKIAGGVAKDFLAAPGQALNAIDQKIASGLQKGVDAVGGAVSDTILPDNTGNPVVEADPVELAQPTTPAIPVAPVPVSPVEPPVAEVAVLPSRPLSMSPNSAQHDLVEGYKAASTALATKADLDSQELKQRAALLQQEQDETLKFQERQAVAAATHAARLQKAEDDYADLQAKYEELARVRINPNRMFQNEDNGQRAMSILSAALFGFVGKSDQWLQQVNSLVKQDVEAQMMDLQNRRESLDKQVGIQGNIVQLARERGLNDREAISAAQATMKEGMARRLEIISANSGSEKVKAEAQAKIADLRISAAKDKAVMQQHSQAAAQDAARTEVARFDAMTRRMEAIGQAQARMAASGKQGGSKITDSSAQRIADLRSSINMAKNLGSEFKEKASGLASKIAATIDFTGQSDSAEYDTRRALAVKLLGRALEGGKTTDSDFSQYEKLIPKAGTFGGAVAWDNLIKTLQDKLKTEVDTLDATGHDVSDLRATPDSISSFKRKQ